MSDIGLVDDIGILLDNQFVWLTRGTNLRGAEMPDEPDFLVGVFQFAGPKPEYSFEKMEWENPKLQIRVRSFGFVEAITRSYEIWKFLGTQQSITVNGSEYIDIDPDSVPFQPSGPDTQGRIEFVSNFSTSRVL